VSLGAGEYAVDEYLDLIDAQPNQSLALSCEILLVNQPGTVSKAEDMVDVAKAANCATVVSARSRDTEDYWLADLAIGWRAGQIKIGSHAQRANREMEPAT
jgi:enolase